MKQSTYFEWTKIHPIFSHVMQDIVTISVRRGGVDVGQSHNQWLSTISQAPNIISMSFVPITSLLGGVQGNGFLSHAVNLYLRCECKFSYFQLGLPWLTVQIVCIIFLLSLNNILSQW